MLGELGKKYMPAAGAKDWKMEDGDQNKEPQSILFRIEENSEGMEDGERNHSMINAVDVTTLTTFIPIT